MTKTPGLIGAPPKNLYRGLLDLTNHPIDHISAIEPAIVVYTAAVFCDIVQKRYEAFWPTKVLSMFSKFGLFENHT